MVTFQEPKALHVLAKEVSEFAQQWLVKCILLDLLDLEHQLLVLRGLCRHWSDAFWSVALGDLLCNEVSLWVNWLPRLV